MQTYWHIHQSVPGFSEHNTSKFEEAVKVVQSFQILLRKLHTTAGLFDVLRPGYETLAALLCTSALLCLLVCAQLFHIICKAESIPAWQR